MASHSENRLERRPDDKDGWYRWGVLRYRLPANEDGCRGLTDGWYDDWRCAKAVYDMWVKEYGPQGWQFVLIESHEGCDTQSVKVAA